jgi:hypothetical protein
MTSESNPPEMPRRPDEPSGMSEAMSGAMSDAKAAIDRAGFSTPQGMVAAGAIILLAVEVVFGLILEDYFLDYVVLVLSVVAVLVFMGRTATAEKIAPVPAVMKALGYLLTIIGAWILIYDLRYPQDTLDEMPDVLAAILAYAGFVLAFLGARSIKV